MNKLSEENCLSSSNRTILYYLLPEFITKALFIDFLGLIKDNHSFLYEMLPHIIKNLIVKEENDINRPNFLSFIPVEAALLRKNLFNLIISQSSLKSLAEQALIIIDELRYKYGKPLDEPRHPDIGSGHAWPLISERN